jgi:hypothetical protein
VLELLRRFTSDAVWLSRKIRMVRHVAYSNLLCVLIRTGRYWHYNTNIQTIPSQIAVATYPRRTSFRWKSMGQISNEYMYNVQQCTIAWLYSSQYARSCTSIVISSSPNTILACLLGKLTKRHDALDHVHPRWQSTRLKSARLMRRAPEGRVTLQDWRRAGLGYLACGLEGRDESLF